MQQLDDCFVANKLSFSVKNPATVFLYVLVFANTTRHSSARLENIPLVYSSMFF